MPKTPPISRMELLVPDAMPISEGGTDPTTALATVGKHREMPTPATPSGTASGQPHVSRHPRDVSQNSLLPLSGVGARIGVLRGAGPQAAPVAPPPPAHAHEGDDDERQRSQAHPRAHSRAQ